MVGAATACLVGGVLPWINSEIAVVSASLLLSETTLPALVLACAAGQMTAKCGLYGVTRWAPHLLPSRARGLLDRAHRYGRRRHLLAIGAFTGALVAIPPFYLVTLACGVLRMPFALFAVAGAAGTTIRYGLLVWAALAIPF